MPQPARLLAIVLLSVLVAAGSAGARIDPPGHATPPTTIPAPIGGPQPTISLQPASGYTGQQIDVSGQGVDPYPGVRVAWLYGDATITAAVVTRGADSSYRASVAIPDDAPPGPAKLCAAVTGSPLAAFACADFSIEAPPPGMVRAQFPLAQMQGAAPQAALDATLNIYTQAGDAVASAPLGADGSVSVPNVPPGHYTAAVVGAVPFLVDPAPVEVQPGRTVTVPLIRAAGDDKVAVSAVRLSPSGPSTSEYDFGFFVIGDIVFPLVSQADLQVVGGTNVESVRWMTSNNIWGASASSPLAGAPYTYQGSGDALFYGGSVAPGLTPLTITPISPRPGDFVNVGRPATRTLMLLANPFQHTPFREGDPGGQFHWNGNGYDFAYGIPSTFNYDLMYSPYWYGFNIDGQPALPLTFPDPPPALPLLGKLENKFNAAFLVSGKLQLDGTVQFTIVRARYKSLVLSLGPFQDERLLIPEDATNQLAGTLSGTSGGATRLAGLEQLSQGRLDQVAIPLGTRQLASFDKDLTVYSGVLLAVPPFAIVRLSVSVGISGELILSGTLRPLVPALDLALTGRGGPRVSISLMVDALFGLVSGGVDVITQANLNVPIRLQSAPSPRVFADNPCMQLQVLARIWIRVLVFQTDPPPNILVDYQAGNCTGSTLAADRMAALSGAPAPPRVLAAPAIASSPDGQMLAVYVADSMPDALTPTMQVMARFRDPVSGQWGTALPLTDGSHAVSDPVAAFGPGNTPIVAWTEVVMTSAEVAAAGDDLNTIVKHQELFYTTWNGATWSAPMQLTTDDLADGRPALAGDGLGVTLAWIRNISGDVTSTTGRIALLEWDGVVWTPLRLLNGTGSAPDAPPAMNAQVSVSRALIGGGSARRLLTWVVDSDGDLNTNGDRRIVIARSDAPNGPDWAISQPAILPGGAQSPSIAINPSNPDTAGLAFLVHGTDADGTTDMGAGNQAAIWTAWQDAGGTWQASQLKDAAGAPVRGEQPRLSISATGEPLLLARRFGAAGTNGEVGQLLLTQLISDGSARPPLYLTDDSRQHWQPALAIDPATGQVQVLSVGRAAIAGGQPASAATLLKPAMQGAHPVTQTKTLAESDDPLESLTIEAGADPALDPLLALTQQHGAPGSTVVMTATVRNLGRAPATGLVVSFYSGAPGSGTLLGSVPVAAPLEFNEARAVTFQVTAAGGPQPITAEVTADSNISAINDRATADLSTLPPPTLVMVSAFSRTSNALQVRWQAPAVAGVAGYRILRSTTPGGPYDLVGEATGTVFHDVLLQRGATYSYVVQAYDAGGTVSTPSAEVSGGLSALTMYLPLVLR